MQSLIGVMKDIKSANEQAPTVHPSSELPRLFSSRPFTMISSDIRSKGSAESESSGLEIGRLPSQCFKFIDILARQSEPSCVRVFSVFCSVILNLHRWIFYLFVESFLCSH